MAFTLILHCHNQPQFSVACGRHSLWLYELTISGGMMIPLYSRWCKRSTLIWAAGLVAGVATLLPLCRWRFCQCGFPDRITAMIERCTCIDFGLPGDYGGSITGVFFRDQLFTLDYIKTLPVLPRLSSVVSPRSVERNSHNKVNPQLRKESARSLGKTPWQT